MPPICFRVPPGGSIAASAIVDRIVAIVLPFVKSCSGPGVAGFAWRGTNESVVRAVITPWEQ